MIFSAWIYIVLVISLVLVFLSGYFFGKRPKKTKKKKQKKRKNKSPEISKEDIGKLARVINYGASLDEMRRYARANCFSFSDFEDDLEQIYNEELSISHPKT